MIKSPVSSTGAQFTWRYYLGAISIVLILSSLAVPARTGPNGGFALARVLSTFHACKSLASALKGYADEYGHAPPMNPPELVKALNGENERRIVFYKQEGKEKMTEQDLADAWHEPFRIDVSNPKNPRVYSPGSNDVDEPNDPNSDDIRSWSESVRMPGIEAYMPWLALVGLLGLVVTIVAKLRARRRTACNPAHTE